MLWLALASALLFALFYTVWKLDPARLACGWLFCAFLGVGGTAYLALVLWLNSPWLSWTVVAVALAVLLVLMFGIYLLIVLLLLNFRLMFKRERHSLKNSLTLIWALLLIAYLAVSALMGVWRPPVWLGSLWAGCTGVVLYSFVHIFVFLVTFLLCNLARPASRQRYIIVLGSGLIGGQVPPLLAARIRRAIRFYQRQAKKHTPLKLVMSGGQGGDEGRSEAGAMRDYALGQGVPARDILTETASASTDENMRFSKRVIEADGGDARRGILYATSNYHLLRAGMYARRAGLRARGIGARTALYYLPSALLREYVGLLALRRVRMAVAAGLVFLGGALLYLLPRVTVWLRAG